MKHLLYIGAFWLAFIVSATGQAFTHSFSGLGTTEEKTIMIDGMKVVFPADEEDVIQLLLPAFKIDRAARKTHVAEAGKKIDEIFVGLKPDFEKRIKQLLGIDELSDGFDEAFEKERKKVNNISRQWRKWCGDIREIHFWNQATVDPFVNSETGEIIFDEIKYFSAPNGDRRFTLHPPFMANFGLGIGRLRPNFKNVKAIRVDIPIPGRPGDSASSIASKIMIVMVEISGTQAKMEAQTGGVFMVKEFLESLLLHEIKAQFFTENTPTSFTRGMARYYLLLNMLLSEKEKLPQLLPDLFYFPFPEKREKAAKLLNKLAKMDPLHTDDPELQDAAGRILMMAVFMAAQNSDNDKAIFTEFRKHEIEIPDGGLNRKEFIAGLHKVHPNIDKHLSETRAKLVKMMRSNFLKTPEETQPKKKKPFVLPETYAKREIDGLTFSYPKVMAKALDQLGPEWAKKLPAGQAILKKRFNIPLVQSIQISETDSDSVQKYGLNGNIDELRFWTRQTALVANAGHLLLRFFSGNEVQIWFKKDLLALLKSGMDVPDFSLNKAGNSVNYNFSFTYEADDSVSNVLELIESYPSKIFPVVINEAEKVAKAPINEQISAIKDGDVLVERLSESADTITPEQLTGKAVRFFSRQKAFFVVIHEVAEADLLRGTIASDDRRWFCDGLANVIAIRECDRRFGKGVGMKTFNSMLPEKEAKQHISKIDLLKWAALENENESVAEAGGLSAAYYFYATKALLEATKGRDTQFIAEWISKINETNWNRTNSETVIRAYDGLTGKDLRHILTGAVKPKS